MACPGLTAVLAFTMRSRFTACPPLTRRSGSTMCSPLPAGSDPTGLLGSPLIFSSFSPTALPEPPAGSDAAPGHGGPAGRSWSWPVTTARSALTAACMRCRISSDSTGAAGADPPRAAPRTRCGKCRLRSSSPIPSNPLHGTHSRTLRPHGIAQHRINGHSSEITNCDNYYADIEPAPQAGSAPPHAIRGYFPAKFAEHPPFKRTYRYRLVCGVSFRTAGLR